MSQFEFWQWDYPAMALKDSVLTNIPSVMNFGLLLGYGARLGFGCNIGALFSGIASASLHAWIWFASAFVGSLIGIRLRPWFRLLN